MTQLILKYEGQYSPDAIWSQYGGQHMGGSLWRFSLGKDALDVLLEKIIRNTDAQTLNTTLALLLKSDLSDCTEAAPLAALESAMPVQAMYAHGPKFFCFVYDHGKWDARGGQEGRV